MGDKDTNCTLWLGNKKNEILKKGPFFSFFLSKSVSSFIFFIRNHRNLTARQSLDSQTKALFYLTVLNERPFIEISMPKAEVNEVPQPTQVII